MEQLFYKPENYNIVPLPEIQEGYSIGFDPHSKDGDEPAVVTIFDSTGKVVSSQKQPVWMTQQEAHAEQQFQLRKLAEMFPTLQGFLWDVKPKTT